MKLNHLIYYQKQMAAWSMEGQEETLPTATTPEMQVKCALEPDYQLYGPCKCLQMLTGPQCCHMGIHILSIV